MVAYLVSDYSYALRSIDDNFLDDLEIEDVVSTEKNETKLKDIITDQLNKVGNIDLLDFFDGTVSKILIDGDLIESDKELDYRKTLSEKFENKDVLENLEVSNLSDDFYRGKMFSIERTADPEKDVEEGLLRNAILNNNLLEADLEDAKPSKMQTEMHIKYPPKSVKTATEEKEELETASKIVTIIDTHEQIKELYDKANIKYRVEQETSSASEPSRKTFAFHEGHMKDVGSMLDRLYGSNLNTTHIDANYENGALIYDTFRTFRSTISENKKEGKVGLEVINYTIQPNIGATRFKIPVKTGAENRPEKLARNEIQVIRGAAELPPEIQQFLNIISRNYATLENEVR